MSAERFMYGDLDALDRVEPVKTVLLVGFQGQTQLLTGTRNALWREFMQAGWHYFLPQELGTARVEDCIIDHPNLVQLIEGFGK